MRRRRERGAAGSEGGVALIIVLIVLALLLTVAGEFTLAMRLEGSTTQNFRASVIGGYLAEAAYHRALVEIVPEAVAHYLDEKGDLIFRHSRTEAMPAPDRTDLALGSGRFSYRITDEESRININRATPDQLHRLLQELGIEKEERDVIVDSIQDWRDPNDEHRLNGAESDYYLGLPVPYKARNADFEMVEELLLVKGVTPTIFYGTPDHPGLVEYLTIAGAGPINVNTASDLVLRSLGYAQPEVDLIRQARPYLDLQGLPPAMRRPNVPLTTRASTFRIEARGELPGQGRRSLRAIVQRLSGSRDGGLPISVRSWQWVEEENTPQ
jgi:general secretion pathway protein K